jgi:hypothetical protein
VSTLAILQRHFQEALVGGNEAAILARIKTGRLLPAERLRIYRNNAYEGFRGALAGAYPVVERLVGQGCFRGLALAYLHGYPSLAGDLADYGQNFAELLDSRYAQSAFAYLSDVARLWAYQNVMVAANADTLRAEDLAELSAGRGCVKTVRKISRQRSQ